MVTIMSKEKQLLKNTAIITIGKICTQFISFILLPLYTVLLTQEDFGIVDLLNTLISLFIPIITLQIEQATFRYLIDVRKSYEKKSEIITTTLVIVIIQSILYIILFGIFSPLYQNEFKWFLLFNVIVCIYSSIFLQIARGLGENTHYAIGSFITASVTLLLNVVFIVFFRWGAYGMLLASLFGNIVCCLYEIIFVRIYSYIKIKAFDMGKGRELLKFSIPMIPNVVSWWIFGSSDRLIISLFLGLGANGIYSAANKFSGLFTTIYNIFNMTWTESASLYIDSKDRKEFYSKVINISYSLFFSIFLLLIASMPFLFPIFIKGDFGDSYYQIPILLLASMFNVVVGLISVFYVALKKTKELAKTSTIAAVINIILTVGLMKWLGLYAASIGTAVAYFLLMIYRIGDVRKYVEISYNIKNIVISILSTSIVFITYYLDNYIINIISLIFCICIVLLMNKNSIYYIKKFIESKFHINRM